MELYPTKYVSADAHERAMAPLVPFRNATRDHDGLWLPVHEQDFAALSGIRHHGSIPYSKEENGIIERAN